MSAGHRARQLYERLGEVKTEAEREDIVEQFLSDVFYKEFNATESRCSFLWSEQVADGESGSFLVFFDELQHQPSRLEYTGDDVSVEIWVEDIAWELLPGDIAPQDISEHLDADEFYSIVREFDETIHVAFTKIKLIGD